MQFVNLEFLTDPEEILKMGLNQKYFDSDDSKAPQKDFYNSFTLYELIKMHQNNEVVNKSLLNKLKQRFKNCLLVDQGARVQLYQIIGLIEYRKKQNPHYYDSILNLHNYPTYNDLTIEKVPCLLTFQLIIKDVKRTVPKTTLYTKDIFQDKLRRVLMAYSRRNLFIGYCQGFNYIVQFFLEMELEEQDCFWIFSHLIESIVPPDYYNSMTGVLTDDKVLEILIKIRLPRLWSKINDMGISTSVFSIQWFVCLFTFNIHWDMSKLIMENILVYGRITIIKASFIIVQIMHDDLIKCTDLGVFLRKIDQFLTTNNKIKDFQLRLNSFYLNKNYLRRAQEKIKERILSDKLCQDVKFQAKRIIQSHNLLTITCNPKHALCVYVREKQKIDKDHVEFFIYRVPEFYVINNYIDNPTQTPNQKTQLKSYILISRDHHECMQSKLIANASSQLSFSGVWETSIADVRLATYLQQINSIDYENNIIVDDSKSVKSENYHQHVQRKNRSPLKDFLMLPIKFLKGQEPPKMQRPKVQPKLEALSSNQETSSNLEQRGYMMIISIFIQNRKRIWSPKKFQHSSRMKKQPMRLQSPKTFTHSKDYEQQKHLEQETGNLREFNALMMKNEINSTSMIFLADLVVGDEQLRSMFKLPPDTGMHTSQIMQTQSENEIFRQS